ncbi:bifunctional folylpolyglutamate synthase/dihydrofolate synthase [Synechococcus elongatus]|uniref:bifunctional folylpolyglutamate synthase/dihydrofolate synthase n=1 Tax=Synechococcus elongatus TaxID=32046 RepID=UPI000F7F35EB|nr:folylpolyglutamate synthase/dihydrofolate synthase family protein [Synechococcus elongatus]
MSLAELDRLLGSFAQRGVDLGLDRSLSVLERLGNPQNQIPIVHIAGTNGKGSTCAFVDTALRANGYRVGRYTSPHLISWCERLQLNGQQVSSDRLLEAVQTVLAAADGIDLTPFELLTAAVWLVLADSDLDIAVIETGLGGRLDATNVVAQPLVTAITSIGHDHQAVLGPTLGAIAAEKAGIIKSRCPVVVGPLLPEARTVIRNRAEQLQALMIAIEPATVIESGLWQSQGLTYQSGLIGDVQRINSAIAIAILRQLQQQGWGLQDAAIAQGLADTDWPGRLQWLDYQGRRLLIDGAHNPEAAIALRQAVDQLLPNQSITWLIGMLRAKDAQAVLATLLRSGDRCIAIPVPDHDCWSSEELQTWAAAQGAIASTAADWAEGLAIAQTYPEAIVFCGSLYLLGDFLQKVTKTV